MIEKKIAVLALGCLLLQGCGASESDAQQVVRDGLKDPGSAKFGEFSQIGERLGCMTVNSKNSLGGYMSPTPGFVARCWTFQNPPCAVFGMSAIYPASQATYSMPFSISPVRAILFSLDSAKLISRLLLSSAWLSS